MIAALGARVPAIHFTERKPLVMWLLCWILLPNAGFWLLWIVGSPPRYFEILATGVAGLVVRNRPYALKITVFLIILVYSLLSFVASLFNLAIASLLASLQFAAELRPGASIEYGMCLAGTVLTVGMAIHLMRRLTAFQGGVSLLIATAAIFAAAGLDYWMSLNGAYSRIAPTGAPFESAVTDSGFSAQADGKRDLILVIVESMGLPNDPAMRDRLTTRWRQPDIAARYTMTQGATSYFGSTTSGEVRELCGRWGDYYDLVDRKDSACLPARMAAKGYRTTALHSFAGDFFARDQWYPNIGFDRMLFREELVGDGATVCPGVFAGACDRDIPAIMRADLAGDPRPQFIYWLTVNSHLPVPADTALRTTDCRTDELASIRVFGMICRQFKLWDDIAESLAVQITRSDFPDADILLVGDHMPPYFDRAQRSQFDPGRVPWILLRRKTAPPVASALAAR